MFHDPDFNFKLYRYYIIALFARLHDFGLLFATYFEKILA
jgi:hypothetical protein